MVYDPQTLFQVEGRVAAAVPQVDLHQQALAIQPLARRRITTFAPLEQHSAP